MNNLIKEFPNIYACKRQKIGNGYLLAFQYNEAGIIYCTSIGGSLSDKESMAARGEEKNWYNVLSDEAVREKLYDAFEEAYGKFMNATARKKVPELIERIFNQTRHENQEIQAAKVPWLMTTEGNR